MIRVGFSFSFDENWMGGINYFRNLLTALYDFPERRIEVVVFTGVDAQEKHFQGFPQIRIVRSRLLQRRSLAGIFRRAVIRIFSRDVLFEWLLIRNKVNVLSHSGSLGKRAKIPTIAWIPDFQHVHLPEFFSAEEIEARNRTFYDWCHYCNTIVVSSYEAKKDLQRYEPGCQNKIEVLQFVVAPMRDDMHRPNREELEKRFGFKGQYFLLPNQFWKHKNHLLVIEALALLKAENREVLVVATGSTEDYRHPEYFESLMATAGKLDVLDCFLPLGMVTHIDLSALMRNAKAIINPSLFEGWSTTVEEAKSLGKYLLLSDIPVHREQAPEIADYFPPHDKRALATLLWNVWNIPANDEEDSANRARLIANKRRRDFAENYQNIVIRACSH